MTVHFGTFYVTGADVALENTFGKISLQELQESLLKNARHRKVAERSNAMIEKQKTEEKKEKEKMQLVTLKNAFNKVIYDDPWPKNKNDKSKFIAKKIACGFYPSILNFNSSTDEEKYLHLVDDVLNNAENILFGLGYVLHQRNVDEVYKATFNHSTSYILDVLLNADLSLKSFRQKPLTWIHATVLQCNSLDLEKNRGIDVNGNNNSKLNNAANNSKTNFNIDELENLKKKLLSHAIRLKVETQEEVLQDSVLFKFVYPVTTTTSNDAMKIVDEMEKKLMLQKLAPIEVFQKNGEKFVKTSSCLSSFAIKKLTHIRNIVCKNVYKKDNCEVCVTRGFYFFKISENDVNFKKKKFHEISFYCNNPVVLKSWLNNQASWSEARSWMETIITNVLELSNAFSSFEIK
jgi:hypothetical protein